MFRIVFLILIFFLSPACAFIDNEVQLEYQDVESVAAKDPGQGTIYMSLFDDQRNDKTKIGVIKNSYGMETAKVFTKDDPVIWVSNSLKGGLEKSGFQVETIDKRFSPMPDQFFLSGDLIKVYSEPQVGFFTITHRGEVQVFVEAEYNGNSTRQMITGNSSTESLLTTGGETHKGVLNGALSDFVIKVVAWIKKLRN
tara:strand:+ start:20 stop:610 length:591 start_codon:yes stop_codon:yes gene_type:complete